MWARLVSLYHSIFAPADPQRAFAEEVARLARRRPGSPQVTIDFEAFSLHLAAENGGTDTLFLGNLFAQAGKLEGKERLACITRFLDGLLDRPEADWAVERPLLLPVLRAVTFGLEVDGPALLRRPALPFLPALFAVDRPTTTKLIGEQAVEAWGVTVDEVLTAADEGLFALDPPNVVRIDEAPGHIYSIEAAEGHAPSRLLLPGFLKSFERRVDGRPLAAIPERSMLLIGGDANEDAVVWLQKKAKELYENARAGLSPALYTVAADDPAGRVVPYLPEGREGVAFDVRVAHLVLAGNEYDRQKQHLDKVHERTEQAIFVASFRVRASDDGRTFSSSVWRSNLRTYLPRSDEIALAFGDDFDAIEWVYFVPFEAVEHLLTPVEGLDPPRFETTGAFPDKAEAARLPGAQAVPLRDR
jgi:hypothetical protein